MTADNIRKAEALTRIGLAVFPVLVTPDPDNPYKTRKRPAIPAAHEQGDPCKGECGKLGHGFYDATLDPFYAHDLFAKYPTAEVGVYMGKSGLVAADFDMKRTPEGEILVDGYENFLGEWLDLPETYNFDSISGAGGKQYIYTAPEDVHLARKSDYRKIAGLDRQAGDSYSVWAGDVPESRDVFAPAPEWLLDVSEVRSAAAFQGAVQDWYATLQPGEPNLPVRKAMDDARALYAEKGDDLSHSDIVELQHRAVRLGAEQNSGVIELLALLEELTLSRTGAHSRNPEEYAHEFAEALASGIQKHGGAIDLWPLIPKYNISDLPSSVPTGLVTGEPGDKTAFSALLRSLIDVSSDDYYVTSVLWNSARTSNIAREWGLEFVYKRVTDARLVPEPIRENASLPDRSEIVPEKEGKKVAGGFLTSEERKQVAGAYTFVNAYLEASGKKGFSVPEYDVPAAWTALSMAVGTNAIISYNGLGVNLWFIEMGNTGTGKSQSQKFLKGVLDITLREGDGYYNLGASSSPAAIHEELLSRDGKSSMVHHDEAASFFSDLHNTEWMKTLEHHFSKFYDGEVEPSNKIRLPAELRGKFARTSFNLNMSATPDKLLSLVTTGMFESGFLSRVNWTWAPDRPATDDRFDIRPSEVDVTTRTHPAVYDLVSDLTSIRGVIPPGTIVGATDEAWVRLSQAALKFDEASRGLEMYDVIRGPLTRHMETMVKCAALLALYRGDTDFTLSDALVAISYAEGWYNAMIRVVSETSESDFSRDCLEIERYIRAEGGKVSEAKFNHRFRKMIRKSPRELDDRIDHLIRSGRVNRMSDKDNGNRIMFELNGGY